MIKIIIADDHELVRAGLSQCLDLAAGVTVVAEAADGDMLLEKLHTTPTDLVLLDLSMPGLCDAGLITHLRSTYPDLLILVLSMHSDIQTILRTMKAGASGFISKNCKPPELLIAINKVYATGRYLPPEMAEQLAFASANNVTDTPLSQLSTREKQIFSMLLKGIAINEIAQQLCISDKTVSTHKSNLLSKLGLRNIADLVHFAMNNKIEIS